MPLLSELAILRYLCSPKVSDLSLRITYIHLLQYCSFFLSLYCRYLCSSIVSNLSLRITYIHQLQYCFFLLCLFCFCFILFIRLLLFVCPLT